MPFDKHIIGPVPAVIRALFNVSQLESEWGGGTRGPAAICSPLPSPRDSSGATGEGPVLGGVTQSRRRVDTVCHPLVFGTTWSLITGGVTLERCRLPRLDSSASSQGCEKRSALMSHMCSTDLTFRVSLG